MSIVFDGTAANNLDMGTSRNYLRNTMGGTVMGWLLLTSLGTTRSMISISVGPSSSTRTKLSILTGGAVEIRARALDAQAASDAFNTGATVLTVSRRYHVAATINYNSASGIIYIDGEAAVAGVFSTMATGGASSDTAALTGTIGANETGGSAPWLGYIEDARVYNRLLPAPEIKTIATSKGADGITQGLAGRWLMTERASGLTVATVPDLSVNNYSLEAAGSLVYGAGEVVARRRRPRALTRY